MSFPTHHIRPLSSGGAAALADEVPVALSYGGTTQAVMMATPANLEEFGIGFSLTDGVVDHLTEIEELVVQHAGQGIDIQMRLAPFRAKGFQSRRRAQMGPAGCGLCGIDSIEEALRPAAHVQSHVTLSRADIARGMTSLTGHQALHNTTHAVHAAGLWRAGHGLVAVREDVGRHNALDKLVGFAACEAVPGSATAVFLTSRVSVEMVQKTARLGTGLIVAVSAPTNRAVQMAEAAGITLVTRVRGERADIHTHPHRLIGASAHVA